MTTRAPDPGHPPKLGRELVRQPDAAVRRRIAGHDAGMQSHAGPGDALHVGHRRIGVDVGAVEPVLLNDGKDAGGRSVPGHAGRHGALRDQPVAAVDPDALLGERDDGEDGAGFGLGRLPFAVRRARSSLTRAAAAGSAATAKATTSSVAARRPPSRRCSPQRGVPRTEPILTTCRVQTHGCTLPDDMGNSTPNLVTQRPHFSTSSPGGNELDNALTACALPPRNSNICVTRQSAMVKPVEGAADESTGTGRRLASLPLSYLRSVTEG